MYESHYEGMAGKSSAKEKDQFRKGSTDAYQRDMFDMMPKWEARPVTKDPSTGITGSMGNRSQLDGPKSGKGQTQNGAKPIKMSKNDGSKDYGKGNPYAKKETKKAMPKSIDDLRKMAREKSA